MISRVLLFVLLWVAGAGAQTVRIGVFGLFHPQDLSVSPAGSVLIMEIAGQSVALDGHSVRVNLSGDSIEASVDSASWRVPRVVIHSRDGGAAGFSLSVPGKIRRKYVGTLEIVARSGELLPVVTMDQEVAVASIVAVESPPGAPLEALKALAVAARSFIVARDSGHLAFDFCDTTHCQHLRQPPPDGSSAAQATRATRGMVLAWHDTVVAAMYTPACGGRTHSLAELDLPAPGYPYYSVECPYCREHPRNWTRDLSRPVNGERDRLDYVREHGWSALPGNNYRLLETDGRLVAEGSGLGHGLGLCERGAAAMAVDGKTFREILDHYYPNTTVVAH